MDSVDFSIYRFLSRDGVARFWAGRRVIDPQVTPREIGEQVGISESGVRSRLRHLSEEGFLKDRTVIPNPSLFGKRIFVTDLLVRQPGEVDRLLRDLALVEGVLFTRDVMDEDERKIQVHFASDNDVTAARLGALLGRLATEGALTAPRPYYIPPSEVELSPLDWRVLGALWRRPDSSYAEIAEAVGISLKTAGRIYHHLIDSRSCWWTHGPDSEEFPLALVCVDLRIPQDADPVLQWIRQDGHPWMPVASDGFGLEPDDAATVLAGLVPADLPAVLERFLRKLAGVEGVVKIRRTFALGSVIYTAWLADRIAGQVHVRV